MADGILGLLGNIGDKVQGLLSNPTVQGLGAAAAFGFNPLLGLLAVPGLTNDRDRQQMQNEAARRELVQQKRQTQAQRQLTGLLGDDTAVQAPIGLLNMQGGMDVIDAKRRVPAISTPGGQRQALGLLARANPEAFQSGLLGQLMARPEQTTMQRNLASAGIDPNSETGRNIIRQSILPEPSKFQSFRQALGREPSETEVLDFFGSGGTTVNVNSGEQDKIISPTQLPNFRLADGSELPFGTTYGQAAAAGARVFSAADLAKKDKLKNAIGIVRQLKDLALGDNGVFVGVPNNIIGRAVEGAANIFGDLAGTDASIKRDSYTSLAQGTLAPLARSLGETGSLATEDAARAQQLLVDIEGIPEGEDLARAKFAELEKIFRRGLAKFGTAASDDGNVVKFDDGTTVEFH